MFIYSTIIECDISKLGGFVNARHMLEHGGYVMKCNCYVSKNQDIAATGARLSFAQAGQSGDETIP